MSEPFAGRYPDGFPASMRRSAFGLGRDVVVLGVCSVAFVVILGAAVALEAERMLARAVGVE